MKQIISILAISGSAFIASCSSTSTTDQQAAILERDATIEALKIELAKQRVIDSMNAEFAAVKKTEKSTAVASSRSGSGRSTRTRRASSSNYATYTGAGYSQPQPVYQAQPAVYQQPVYQEPVKQKRGWSAKAKGAIIGAGTGAVSGAVINKRDRVKGAIIGGVLGAGMGTGIGAIIDKKNGR